MYTYCDLDFEISHTIPNNVLYSWLLRDYDGRVGRVQCCSIALVLATHETLPFVQQIVCNRYKCRDSHV
jgi:hypothetical protein